MADLTAAQTLDMLADLAAGAIGDVFSQAELQRLFDRAGDDYNLAVYYGWRQIAGNAAKWTEYQVAQTKVSRAKAAEILKSMLELWGKESRTNANQVAILGAAPVPTIHKPQPLDEYPKSWPYRWSRWR